MTKPARFLFELDFGAPPEPQNDPADMVEEIASVPTIELPRHEALLDQARQAAYEQGRQAGIQEGRDSAESQAAQSLSSEAARLADAAQSIMAAFETDRQRAERDAADLALCVARTLAKELVAREPETEIIALISDCLAPLRATPHLAVRLANDLADQMRETLETMARDRGMSGRLMVIGEPDLKPGDCRIEWADGGIIRDMDELEARIRQSMMDYFSAKDHARGKTTPDYAAESHDQTDPQNEVGAETLGE